MHQNSGLLCKQLAIAAARTIHTNLHASFSRVASAPTGRKGNKPVLDNFASAVVFRSTVLPEQCPDPLLEGRTMNSVYGGVIKLGRPHDAEALMHEVSHYPKCYGGR